jgi:GTPase SAR1 family protein
VPLVFLANKIDLKSGSNTLKEQMKFFSRSFSTEYYFTSAKTGENVEDAFQDLAENMVSKKDVSKKGGSKKDKK